MHTKQRLNYTHTTPHFCKQVLHLYHKGREREGEERWRATQQRQLEREKGKRWRHRERGSERSGYGGEKGRGEGAELFKHKQTWL